MTPAADPKRSSPKGSRPKGAKAAKKADAGRLSDQLCFALYSATNAITRVYRPLLREIGLTYPQYLVLLVLWEHRTRRLGQIAEDLQLAPHALPPLIDRLEEAGLVVRTKDPDDGRIVHVSLTKAGTALESEAADVQGQVRDRTLLDPDEVDRLRSELQALIDQLDGK